MENNIDILKVGGILSKGYGNIPKLVMQDTRLTIEAKSIYAYFQSYAGDGDTAFPKIKTILYHLGIGKDRFYIHYKQLVELCYVTSVQVQGRKGRFSHCVYTLHTTIDMSLQLKPIIKKKKKSPSTENKDTAPSTENKDTAPSTENKDTAPSTENKDTAPSTENKDTAPSTENKDTAPSTENKDTAPSTENKDTAPSTENKDIAPSTENQTSDNQTSENTTTNNNMVNKNSLNTNNDDEDEGNKKIALFKEKNDKENKALKGKKTGSGFPANTALSIENSLLAEVAGSTMADLEQAKHRLSINKVPIQQPFKWLLTTLHGIVRDKDIQIPKNPAINKKATRRKKGSNYGPRQATDKYAKYYDMVQDSPKPLIDINSTNLDEMIPFEI